jgi:hypothetical protein
MSQVSLVALADYRYAGRPVAKGETFEATESDAVMLRAAGRAKDLASTRQPYKRRSRRQDITPEAAE